MATLRCSLVAAALLFAVRPALPADSSSNTPSPSTTGPDLKAMDTSISPCQNFYQYACGGWRKNNPIPSDQSRWGRFNELAEHNLATEQNILEKFESPNPNRTPVEQKIGDYYESCMDEPEIETRGVKPIEPELHEIDAIASKQQLADELARLHARGVRALFNFAVRPDEKKSNEEIVNVDQGGLGLPDRDYYLKPEKRFADLRAQYQKTVADFFELLAKAEGKTDAGSEADAKAVMAIETELAKASMDRVMRRNPDNTYHKMTVAELAALTPDFGWKEFLGNVGIAPIQDLNVAVPDFVKALNAVIENTSLADMKTYLKWHVLLADASLLPAAFEDARFHFYDHILNGAAEIAPRWKRCVRSADRALGEALGQEFVQVAFNGPSKQKALELVGEIEKEMKEDIESADWMTPATKKQALEKLKLVANKIGYPEKWRDYSSVKIVRDDYFHDALRAREFEVKRNFNKLGKPVDKAEWSMTPPTVNAYYSPSMNNINFPAGILQPPFYNPKADDAVNYGAIGVVIGHELTHGFDDQGRRYDGEGNLRDWWTAEDAGNFKARAKCISDEYGNFSPVEGVKLKGELTLGENAADNGGIHLAYMALMDRLAGHVLPKNEGFTPEQEFFLGYAQVWCENVTPESSRARAMTDPHSPGQFRVNGTVQNMKEFQKAFSCKAGDPMVSANPCRVW